MKEYVNLLFSIIDKINDWETKNINEKKEILNIYMDTSQNNENIVNYFEKYRNFLVKNSFNNLAKDILTQ